jgi:hypothetical protein
MKDDAVALPDPSRGGDSDMDVIDFPTDRVSDIRRTRR